MSARVPVTTSRVFGSLSAREEMLYKGETVSGVPDSLRIVNVSPEIFFDVALDTLAAGPQQVLSPFPQEPSTEDH
jgi:hypothetical protein